MRHAIAGGDSVATAARRTSMRTLALQTAAMLALALTGSIALAHGQAGNCETSAQQPAIAAARATLERKPEALSGRFELADLLVEAGCYDEAVHVLEAGEATNPRNGDLQKRLRTARSLVSEKQFFEGIGEAELQAKVERNMLRCTRFGDLAACDEALKLKPDDAAAMIAKGDALAKANKLTEALEAYNRAAGLSPGSSAIATKIRDAETQRRTLQQRCINETGEAALTACQAVLSKDAPEEFDITRRMAVLHQSNNQPSKALDSYIAANSLRRGDKSVALAIVALADSTGRNDAVALAARGSALMTLGRAREALAALQQAQSLTAGLPGITEQLAAAERLAKQEERMRESQRLAAAPRAATEEKPGTAPQLTAAAAPRTYSNAAPASQSN